jgi:MYXO-CTERM domain-containing protein
VRAQVNSLAIPAESAPGTDTFTATLDVYIPSTTTYAATDRLGVILRWNGSNANNNQVFRTWDSFAPDTWETITLTGTLPVNGGDGQPLTSVVPIISFDDNPADAASGVAAHIDNWSLSVTGVPEPGTGILGLLSAALFLGRRRR